MPAVCLTPRYSHTWYIHVVLLPATAFELGYIIDRCVVDRCAMQSWITRCETIGLSHRVARLTWCRMSHASFIDFDFDSCLAIIVLRTTVVQAHGRLFLHLQTESRKLFVFAAWLKLIKLKCHLLSLHLHAKCTVRSELTCVRTPFRHSTNEYCKSIIRMSILNPFRV